MTPERTRVLEEANRLIVGDRNNTHGEPTQDFTRTAHMWTTYLDGRTTIRPWDVAAMMSLLKISRISWSPDHRDNWVDLAGYAACGWETHTNTNNKEREQQ